MYAVPVAVAVLSRDLAKLLRLRSRLCQPGEVGTAATIVPSYGALGLRSLPIGDLEPSVKQIQNTNLIVYILLFVYIYGLRFNSFITCNVRLGPSASEAPHNNLLSEVLKAMNVLQGAMTEPWAKQLLGGLLPPTPTPVPSVDPKLEMPDQNQNTPKNVAAVGGTPEVPKTDGAVNGGEVKEPSLPSVPVEPKPTAPAEPQTINSSTHRAAHARLVRRMGSEDVIDCPNMQRLWNGSRKDFTKTC